MLLTDEEIAAIPSYPWGSSTEYARAVESAVLAKLRKQKPVGEVTMAAVLPEPNGLYLHEFYCDSRLPVQAELFIRHPAPSAPEWISVDKAIPDAEVSVLVARLGRVNAQITCHTGKEWMLESNHYPVTHWRVIPRTPEQQGLLERMHEGCLKSLAAAKGLK